MEKQYRDASNLNARIALHERFSTNPHPLLRWLFDRLELPPEGRILEIGCGTGKLWVENLERIKGAVADLSCQERRDRISRLEANLRREMAAQGAIRITKDTGLFVASQRS